MKTLIVKKRKRDFLQFLTVTLFVNYFKIKVSLVIEILKPFIFTRKCTTKKTDITTITGASYENDKTGYTILDHTLPAVPHWLPIASSTRPKANAVVDVQKPLDVVKNVAKRR